MAITSADVERFLIEWQAKWPGPDNDHSVYNFDAERWVETEDIDPEMLVNLSQLSLNHFTHKLFSEGENVTIEAIWFGIFCNIYLLGWEMAKEYAKHNRSTL